MLYISLTASIDTTHRTNVNEMVSSLFNGTVRNILSESREDNYWNIATSCFVLCPSGLGYDTYRLWETLLLGSIPIVESNAGFDRTYSYLPVLVVKSYSLLSPALLMRAYECFTTHQHAFHNEHLTQQYWLGVIDTAVRTASVDHMRREHPPRHAVCDFYHG